MSLSARRRNISEDHRILQQRKEERVRNAVRGLLTNDLITINALSTPEDKLDNLDELAKPIIYAATDPGLDYRDAMVNRGFLPAELRKMTHNLFDTYCRTPEDEVEVPYEDMFTRVAEFMLENPAIYQSLTPQSLR